MYDIIIGALLVSSWINSMLYMLEITQTYRYFSLFFKKDPVGLQLVVASCFILDTVTTVANHIGVYKYTITNWGVVEYLSQQEWQIPLYLICTGIVAAIVQSFLTWRYYNLSKQMLVCIPLLLLMLASLAGSLATAIMIIHASSLKNRATLKIPVIIWFVVSSFVDCALAALLIFHLRSARTGFRSTKSLINRLSSVALQSGTYTSALAILTLVLYLDKPEGNTGTGCGQCLGRVYTLTLLHNLLIRKNIRDESRAGTHTTGNLESVHLSGIRVHTDRTVLVHMDSDQTRVDRQPSIKKDSDSDQQTPVNRADEYYGASKGHPLA